MPTKDRLRLRIAYFCQILRRPSSDMDVHTETTRSYNMSRIKSRDTKPEISVRKLCHHLGLRFRLNQKLLGTRPDLVFKKHRAVIFVNGCFWHKHDCQYGKVVPKTNIEFWTDKRKRTKNRDIENIAVLEAENWKVLVIWECELKDISVVEEIIRNYFVNST